MKIQTILLLLVFIISLSCFSGGKIYLTNHQYQLVSGFEKTQNPKNRVTDSISKLSIEQLWNYLIFEEGGCLTGGQHVHNGTFGSEGCVMSNSMFWELFFSRNKNELSYFLFDKITANTDTTKIHTCPFFIATESEVAVYGLQKIHGLNWYDFETFKTYKNKESTNSTNNHQVWLHRILKNNRLRKKLINCWINEIEKKIDYSTQVDSLRFVSEMPYMCEVIRKNEALLKKESLSFDVGCGDQLLWKVVLGKQEVIPFLLKKLDDTTLTQATVPFFGGNYTVADIAYVALEEIIKGKPIFELLTTKFDSEGCGYCAYWNYLRNDINNRKKFKHAVTTWYETNKNKLVWVKSDQFLTCEIVGAKHPNGGHFELQK